MRKSLYEILHGSETKLQEAWDKTQAAEEFAPLPAAIYSCKIVKGELCESKKLTPSYKVTFRVREGEFEGRHFWADYWLTEAALPMTKRDLAKLGVTQLSQLDQPLPAMFLCTVKLALRKDDDGNEYNRVRSFEVTGVETVEDFDFAPALAKSETPSLLPLETVKDELELIPAAGKGNGGMSYGNE